MMRMNHEQLMSAVRLVLFRAQRRISKPQRWTRGRFAADARGMKREPNDPRACRWCASGAVAAEVARLTAHELSATDTYHLMERRERVTEAAIRLLSIAARKIHPGDTNIVVLNDDGPGHHTVMKAFRTAIPRLTKPLTSKCS